MEKIFATLLDSFDFADNSEITLEANPGTLDMIHLKDYMSLGVNRISLGIQSFDDNELKFLDRIHTSQEAIDSYYHIRKSGIVNVSLDMIFGIPGQSINSWKNNLTILGQLNPEHISVYNLIYEPETKMEKMLKLGKFSAIDEKIEEDLFFLTSEKLSSFEYFQYEVSNYSKIGFHSKHNSKYWKHIPYYGFGPSAHSFYNNIRYWNISNLKEYFRKIKEKKLPIYNSEILQIKDIMTEKIMLSLRSSGIDLKEFKSQFGIDLLPIIKRNLADYSKYFEIKNNKFILNIHGYFILNEIIISLIKAPELQ